MTRKRLTDLLREEAQKPATDSPLTVDVVAAPVTNEDSTKSTTPKDAPNPATAQTPQISAQKTHEITPDLEAELRQQIIDLKHTINLNQTNIEILQSTIAEKNQSLQRLKNELEESRKDNLRLAEANIQLKEELQNSTAPVTQNKSQVASRQPELRRANATSSANQVASNADKSNSASLSRNTARTSELPPARPGIYGRPIGSNEENQRINNRNIGWMD